MKRWTQGYVLRLIRSTPKLSHANQRIRANVVRDFATSDPDISVCPKGTRASESMWWVIGLLSIKTSLTSNPLRLQVQYSQQSTMSLSKEEFRSDDGSGMLPLLSGEQEYEEEHHSFTRRKPKFPVWPFIVHLIIFCAYTIAFLAYSKSVQGENCHKSLIYCKQNPSCMTDQRANSGQAPVREAVKWERVTSKNELEEKNPYKGPPRPELDDAWHDLLKHSSIRVSKEDLRKINRTSIKLADGSGKYMAEINAYHHLHCLVGFNNLLHCISPI